MAVILATEANDVPLPDDMPQGPWKTHEDAHKALNAWAQDTSTGGGGFALVWQGGLIKRATKGPARKLLCHFCNKAPDPNAAPSGKQTRPSGSCSCPYCICLEEAKEGWIVAYIRNDTHNHPLVQNVIEISNDYAAMKKDLPLVLEVLARQLQIGGNSAKVIHATLVANARELGIPITWCYDDVYARFAPTMAQKCADATGLLDLLVHRERDLGLPFRTHTADDGSLSAALMVLEEGPALYERAGREDSVVVLETTDTLKSFGVKVALLTLAGADGDAALVAACLLLGDAGAAAYAWVLRAFRDALGFAPRAVQTDCDPAVAQAVREEWPGTAHRLCPWSVWHGLVRHVRGLFVADAGRHGKSAGWQTLCVLFWAAQKRTGEAGADDDGFDSDWQATSPLHFTPESPLPLFHLARPVARPVQSPPPGPRGSLRVSVSISASICASLSWLLSRRWPSCLGPSRPVLGPCCDRPPPHASACARARAHTHTHRR